MADIATGTVLTLIAEEGTEGREVGGVVDWYGAWFDTGATLVVALVEVGDSLYFACERAVGLLLLWLGLLLGLLLSLGNRVGTADGGRAVWVTMMEKARGKRDVDGCGARAVLLSHDRCVVIAVFGVLVLLAWTGLEIRPSLPWLWRLVVDDRVLAEP